MTWLANASSTTSSAPGRPRGVADRRRSVLLPRHLQTRPGWPGHRRRRRNEVAPVADGLSGLGQAPESRQPTRVSKKRIRRLSNLQLNLSSQSNNAARNRHHWEATTKRREGMEKPMGAVLNYSSTRRIRITSIALRELTYFIHRLF